MKTGTLEQTSEYSKINNGTPAEQFTQNSTSFTTVRMYRAKYYKRQETGMGCLSHWFVFIYVHSLTCFFNIECLTARPNTIIIDITFQIV